MAEKPSNSGKDAPSSADAADFDFRWTAFFQRSVEPLFVLNRRRQILFVNRSWESLTGLKGRDVLKRVCKRRRDAGPGSSEAVLNALAPPRDVMAGQSARLRRLFARADTTPQWWDIEFLPLRGPLGLLGIIGKVVALASAASGTSQPLPEKLMALRQRQIDSHGIHHLSTESPAMRRIAEQIRLASQTSAAVLLVGEPGTGKEWLARTIHQEGPHREKPFVALDCHRLPTAALAWALFGSPGFAQRAGATLFLKEPHALPRELQARLVDLADAGAAEESKPRLIASSTTDAGAQIQAGRLLEEFHCLLSSVTIQVPPLRQRLSEFSVLAERMLRRAASGRETPVTALTSEAWELLRNYGWPGNLGELYAVLAGACQRAKGDKIDAADLPWFIGAGVNVPERALPLDKLLEQVERRLVQLALVMAKGNKSRAAQMLEIPRVRLLRRLQVLGLKE